MLTVFLVFRSKTDIKIVPASSWNKMRENSDFFRAAFAEPHQIVDALKNSSITEQASDAWNYVSVDSGSALVPPPEFENLFE